MITAWWIFVAFVVGGCAGLLLTALLRTQQIKAPTRWRRQSAASSGRRAGNTEIRFLVAT